MTSQKQFDANRQNALNSTGPRTDHGKRRSRRNAFRHGCFRTYARAIEWIEGESERINQGISNIKEVSIPTEAYGFHYGIVMNAKFNLCGNIF